MRYLFLLLVCITVVQFLPAGRLRAQSASVFPPPEPQPEIYACRTSGKILVDGRLSEPDWNNCRPAPFFVQVEPNQGQPSRYPTLVRILFDQRYLYVGAACYDSNGRKAIRIQDFRRDFSNDNDVFGIAIDPLGNKQTAIAFQTNPGGAQKDLQVFNDQIFDEEWNALWSVRSLITDSGWTCEMAIPWVSLRYPRKKGIDSTGWGVNFFRLARQANETSAYPGFPLSFDTYRMGYSALLKGLQPPLLKSGNLQLNPYAVSQYNRSREKGKPAVSEFNPKFGGDIKWSPTEHSTLDLTFNTDFAQADADLQVNNLRRFNILFPERRQFFLENAGLFDGGDESAFKPFFSRTIGLDGNNSPVPILGGIKYTDKNIRYSLGLLAIRQRSRDNLPAANMTVARYNRNYGEENTLGLMVTHRLDESTDSTLADNNTTLTLTGFNRLNEKWSLDFMLSGSRSTGNISDKGWAGFTRLQRTDNRWNLTWITALVSDEYNPRLGFVARNDFVRHYVDFYQVNRNKKWVPRFIRSFEPGISAELYHGTLDGRVQEAYVDLFPFYTIFQDGALLSFKYSLAWQKLTEPFDPVGVEIAAGDYHYRSFSVDYLSDQSRPLSLIVNATTGGYYNGRIKTVSSRIRYAPSPKIAFRMGYEFNSLTELGPDGVGKTIQLITPGLRLALNPRVQFNAIYQYNTNGNRGFWNLRFSWEYQPLSYLFLVWNQAQSGLLREQQVIGKLSYLRQF